MSPGSRIWGAETHQVAGVGKLEIGRRDCSGPRAFRSSRSLPLPSPPAEQAAARKDQTRQARTGDGTGNARNVYGIDKDGVIAGRRQALKREGI